jgi:hypothetical protein
MHLPSIARVLEYDDIKIALKRMTVGARIERNKMKNKFLPESVDISDGEDDTARWWFIYLAGYTEGISGLPVVMPTSMDSVESFEEKRAAFMEIDDDLLNRWLEGAGELDKLIVPKHQQPAAMLSADEQSDPKLSPPAES